MPKQKTVTESLDTARREMLDAQDRYDRWKREHHSHSRIVRGLKRSEPRMKMAALSRLVDADERIGRGQQVYTKTDAPKYLHEDERWVAYTTSLDEAEDILENAAVELSLARNQLNTARIIVCSYLPFAAPLGDGHNGVTE